MAILCLCKNLETLQEMCGNIYLGDTFEGKAVYARDLNASGAMAVLLKDAIKPNLVQTLEGNPAIIHGGPFANIAQGTNSIVATKMGMSLGEYVVTEAGFAADLGAEKFLNIKCRRAELSPKAVVIVATIRALKFHGGKALDSLREEDVNALEKGIPNLDRHIESIQSFGLPVVVSINAFIDDTEAEIALIYAHCKKLGVPVALSKGWADGGKGCVELAEKVAAAAETCEEKFKPTYDLEDSPLTKMEKVSRKIYGAKNVVLTAVAKRQLKRFEELGYGGLPICMAKTQKSLSDNPKLLGRPENFDIHIRELEIATGAGFIIPIAGNMLRMPGLPLTPSAENIKMDGNGTIAGLF